MALFAHDRDIALDASRSWDPDAPTANNESLFEATAVRTVAMANGPTIIDDARTVCAGFRDAAERR
jgi:hypothetical protein